jgi:septal ring factor EnvC (AmiA/AmiB activator)
VKELENKRKSLLSDIEITNKLLSENKKITTNALNRLSLLVQQINSRKEMITLLNKEIFILDDVIADKEKQIKQLTKELQEKKNNYATAAKKMYLHKSKQDKLLFILSADNFSQSYRRVMYLKKYSGWQKEKAEEIVVEQNEIQLEKEILEKKKAEKEILITERKKEEEKLNVEEDSQKSEVESLKKDQKKLQAELAKKKKEADALNKQIEKVIAAEIAASQKASKSQPHIERKAETKGGYAMTKEEKSLSSDFAGNRGKLPFPLKGSYKVVVRFGVVVHTNINNAETNNNGIEIETTSGNEARAVFDGVVASVFLIGGYNNSVILRHGNYLTVYANIDKMYVKKGDKVKIGQALGRIYTDIDNGNSTRLHFEIWKGQTKLDPLPWLNR